jgi:hypothetical protein
MYFSNLVTVYVSQVLEEDSVISVPLVTMVTRIVNHVPVTLQGQ